MSGPALRQVESHSLIHDAALNEAEELTGLLSQCLEEKEKERALEVAYVIVEHWETRTLKHAESEEEGLYVEIASKSNEKRDQVIALKRDHSLLKLLVNEIKQILTEGEVTQGVLARFEALILLDTLHNHDEMNLLQGEP